MSDSPHFSSKFEHHHSILSIVFIGHYISNIWLFPLLCKSFLVWCSPTCPCLLLWPVLFGVVSKKSLPNSVSWSYLSMLFSKSFIVLALTFRPLFYFELIFVYGINKGLKFIILHVDISFPSIICWKDCPFFTVIYSCLLSHRLIDCKCVGLFPGSLFCSIDLHICFCANSILFW